MKRTYALLVYSASLFGLGWAIIIRGKFDGVSFLLSLAAVMSFVVYIHGTNRKLDRDIAEVNRQIDEDRLLNRAMPKTREAETWAKHKKDMENP